MAPPTHKDFPHDAGPIVFPVPSGRLSDVFPPDFEESSDIIVDPYGNFFCFVCKVNVPKGASNVTQHLEGKKHESNNKRFKSQSQKGDMRQRVLQASLAQRMVQGLPPFTPNAPTASNSTPAPANTSGVTSAPTNSVPAASGAKLKSTASSEDPASPATRQPAPTSNPKSHDHPVPDPSTKRRTEKKKVMREAEARRLKSIQIDKNAFLSELLEDKNCDENPEDTNHGSEDDTSDVEVDVEKRIQPFGALDFKAPPGPDYLFDSMAGESKPSAASAKLRKALASIKGGNSSCDSAEQEQDSGANASARRMKDTSPNTEVNSEGESAAGVSAKTELADSKEEEELELGETREDTEEFLSFGKTEVEEVDEKEKAAREKAIREAQDSLVILKDENGEELPPWLLDPESAERVLFLSDSAIALHYEILEFSRFLSPTQMEIDARNEMLMMVESIVTRLWPESSTEIFGSYATDLYLPSSDIDVCVMGTPEGGSPGEFEKLAEAIRNVTGFARRVSVIKAKVNLVKIVARKTEVNCDISIGVNNGPKYVPVIKKYVESYPALRPLLLVVKCFLRQRNLNEVYTGGLGSYSVLLLVVSHLQMLKYNFPTTKSNLGCVLQLFFQLYGRIFNVCVAGIQVKNNGAYYDKFERYHTAPQETLRFSIEDPNDETNELGLKSFAATRIRKAFTNASKSLKGWRRDDANTTPTVLGCIIQPDSIFKMRRKSVIEDLESKGKKALREEVPWSSKCSTSRVHSQRRESISRPRDNATGNKRAVSPEHRRERDPRLAKRRRSSTASGNDRDNRHSSSNHYSASKNRQNERGINGNNAGQPSNTNGNFTSANQGNGMYNNTMNFANAGGYSAATPGYQYASAMVLSSGGQQPMALYTNDYGSYHDQIAAQSNPQFQEPYNTKSSQGGTGRRGGGKGKKRGGFNGPGGNREY